MPNNDKNGRKRQQHLQQTERIDWQLHKSTTKTKTKSKHKNSSHSRFYILLFLLLLNEF